MKIKLSSINVSSMLTRHTKCIRHKQYYNEVLTEYNIWLSLYYISDLMTLLQKTRGRDLHLQQQYGTIVMQYVATLYNIFILFSTVVFLYRPRY